MPRHVAIIMDGNGRWARARNLPRVMGHRAGVEAVESVLDEADRLGLEYASLFSFSTENWKRPKDEVSALMDLLAEYVDQNLKRLSDQNVRVSLLGDIDNLPAFVRERVRRAEADTRSNDGLNLIIALNYGGRGEIVRAAYQLAEDVLNERVRLGEIDQSLFESYMGVPGVPDPDLIIRTGGEMRLSNFYLWQAAYSELWTTSVFWPDFRGEHLREAIRDYQRRERRFGGLPGER